MLKTLRTGDCFGPTSWMSYRRRETPDAGLADQVSKTEKLAAVSSIRFVRRFLSHLCVCDSKVRPQSDVSLVQTLMSV